MANEVVSILRTADPGSRSKEALDLLGELGRDSHRAKAAPATGRA